MTEHPNDLWRADMTEDEFVQWLISRLTFVQEASRDELATLRSPNLIARNYRRLSDGYGTAGLKGATRIESSIDEFFPFREFEIIAVRPLDLLMHEVRRHDGAGNELSHIAIVRFDGPLAAEWVVYDVEDFDEAKAEFERLAAQH